MAKKYLAVKDGSGEYQHYQVPLAVYNYVRQLEIQIACPEGSKLRELYPERFGKEEEK